ncbi:penicillin-binding protein 2 [Bacteroidales bacterium OttesenSCG-928-B11]|nr:penicillin-binding protein 2 [Bacteroidales bacterium OttesenSCG-928-E04]MDL2311766.1 penicillin-binding protein 2 [Bacteroidales bacterium OttesenSCG-928-B11]MDL2325472.1 penicillin-binding protein 2 [Bacteroidales bacterium OttesenSCG-928-A14]
MPELLNKRIYIIFGIMLVFAVIYIVRLFSLQVTDDFYKRSADENALRYITEHPVRGLIYDRNDSLLVYNEPVYDLMVVPHELREFDTADMCRLLEIDKETLLKRIERARSYSPRLPSTFEQQMSKEDFAYLQEKLYQFPGFFVQSRTLRYYPEPIAAHVLGYVGEVNNDVLENDAYYQLGDYIGISGIEKTYEPELRGVKGKRIVLVDVHNREKGRYRNGEEDVMAIPGQPLWSTLDLSLQKYGEELMRNKRGSIVAIEPSTGEILCIVSSPGYDPNLLVGKNRSRNYANLINDNVNKPIYNRALQAMYPPGSTFKLINGLIAQQEGVLDQNTVYPCPGGYQIGSHTIGCHHGGATNLVSAVQVSCNTYFCKAFYNIISNKKKYPTIQEGYQAWKDHVNRMGFGVTFDTDLPFENKGIIPSVDYFDRIYHGRWNGNSVVSMGIGQGEAATTPLQMANSIAIIANRGYYIKPHIIKAIGSKDIPNDRFNDVIESGINEAHFDPIIRGMVAAVEAGTGRQAIIPGIKVAGKTGTAQNPHGKDHSVFVCFAPAEDPKIAIFVLVENGGWGGSVAAPIASLVVEKYLKGEIGRTDLEKRILELKP